MKDPFVQEVRKYRMEHTRSFGADLHLICEDLRQFEGTLGNRIVSLEPRRFQATRRSRRIAEARA
jgi:hypothetical protein